MTRRPGAGARTALFTVLALAGFAGNSLLCRAALGPRDRIDPLSFTAFRLLAGAGALWLLARGRSHGNARPWRGALALFAYAIAFSLAYVRLEVAAGALLLFGAVQATMLVVAATAGERPGPVALAGIALALAGLVALTLPGWSAPDPLGAALMLSAGIAWGLYTLLGRKTADPLGATAAAFARASLPAAALAGVGLLFLHARASVEGVGLALASGALASGVGYSLWYAALPWLTVTRAAIVQLAVPVVTAAAGAALLGEHPSTRLVGAGAAVVLGILLTIVGRQRIGPRP